MSLRKLLVTSTLALAVSVLAPTRASADWLFTPFIGATFNGAANFGASGSEFDDDFERNLTFGGSFGYMGHGAVGFEVDFGYSPNFFEGDQGGGFDIVGGGNVTTVMGNVIVGAPLGGVRPYASGGVGLIRTRVEDVGQFFDEFSQSDFGLNVGAGVMGFFNDSVGIRGDIRYFRTINDDSSDGIDLSLGDFDFWRGTVGVTFRF
jgi:opacity protein-like surface antigen